MQAYAEVRIAGELYVLVRVDEHKWPQNETRADAELQEAKSSLTGMPSDTHYLLLTFNGEIKTHPADMAPKLDKGELEQLNWAPAPDSWDF